MHERSTRRARGRDTSELRSRDLESHSSMGTREVCHPVDKIQEYWAPRPNGIARVGRGLEIEGMVARLDTKLIRQRWAAMAAWCKAWERKLAVRTESRFQGKENEGILARGEAARPNTPFWGQVRALRESSPSKKDPCPVVASKQGRRRLSLTHGVTGETFCRRARRLNLAGANSGHVICIYSTYGGDSATPGVDIR
jgi:hypothetical protein